MDKFDDEILYFWGRELGFGRAFLPGRRVLGWLAVRDQKVLDP